MATGVIRSFHIQAPAPACFPALLRSPCQKEEPFQAREKPQERQDEDPDEEEEEEEDEEEEEGLDQFVLNPARNVLDATSRLLRFADLISRDVQRYFGRSSEDRDACDIYDDSVSVVTSGRLRYYDDLLRIAGGATPEEPENGGPGLGSGLGPLADLFNHKGASGVRGQPMINRLLPLSFWTEPVPRCPLDSFGGPPDDSAPGQTQPSIPSIPSIPSAEPDFSDLLAYWDPHPEFTHTLMEDAHAD